jgi:hypothetical protein
MSTQTFIERRHGERRQTPTRSAAVPDDVEEAAARAAAGGNPLGGAAMSSARPDTPGHYGAGYGEAGGGSPTDEHYDRWRTDHLRELDDEYHQWRQGGSKNFPADFEAWRLARRQEALQNTPEGDKFFERS